MGDEQERIRELGGESTGRKDEGGGEGEFFHPRVDCEGRGSRQRRWVEKSGRGR